MALTLIIGVVQAGMRYYCYPRVSQINVNRLAILKGVFYTGIPALHTLLSLSALAPPRYKISVLL